MYFDRGEVGCDGGYIGDMDFGVFGLDLFE